LAAHLVPVAQVGLENLGHGVPVHVGSRPSEQLATGSDLGVVTQERKEAIGDVQQLELFLGQSLDGGLDAQRPVTFSGGTSRRRRNHDQGRAQRDKRSKPPVRLASPHV
jgi:hypothetical protein